jgi:outer membrane protein assembly factor BamB
MTDSVVCLDAATGKELWKKDFPVTAKDRPASFLGAAGTPAVWSGKCYFAGIMGLYCLSVQDGTLLWQVKGGGVNASVGVANGVVYGTVGGQPLSAYNPENGNVIWKSDPSAGSVNSSHVVWASGGKNYIIACGGGGTYCCIDIETGKVIWNIKCGNPGGTTPVISGDILVVQPDGCTQAYKMTPAKAELLWKKSISDHAAGPIIYQDHVYLHTSYYAPPWWHCLDLMTGEEKWKQQSSIDSSCNCSSPIVADGKIFHTLGNGHAIENYHIEMLKPTPEKYAPLAAFNPEAAPLASPTVAGGKLYLRLWNGLACYDLKENGVYLDGVNASKAALTFRFAQTGGGLIAKDAAIGIMITDATGASKPAKAKIEGDNIVVDIKDAAMPFGISYAGTNTLTGKNGLPLPAFGWNETRVLTYRKCFDNTIELASNLPLNQTWNTAGMYTVAGATVTSARISGNGVILTTDKTWKAGDAITLTYSCFRVEQGDARNETLTFTVGDIQRAAAKFVKTDDTTAGTWKGLYGAQGAVLAGETARASNCAVVTPRKNENHTFAGSTTDARAPQKSADTKDRIAACWFNNEKFDIDVELTDGKEHQVALYCLDWDGNDGRAFTVELQDTLTNAVLDTQTMKQYSKGKYLIWNVKGQVTLHFVSTGARNAVVSGVFIDPVQTVK